MEANGPGCQCVAWVPNRSPEQALINQRIEEQSHLPGAAIDV